MLLIMIQRQNKTAALNLSLLQPLLSKLQKWSAKSQSTDAEKNLKYFTLIAAYLLKKVKKVKKTVFNTYFWVIF